MASARRCFDVVACQIACGQLKVDCKGVHSLLIKYTPFRNSQRSISVQFPKIYTVFQESRNRCVKSLEESWTEKLLDRLVLGQIHMEARRWSRWRGSVS